MKISRFLALAMTICLFFGGLRIVNGLSELYHTRKCSEVYSSVYAYFVRGEEYRKPASTRPVTHNSNYFVYTYSVNGKDYEIKKDFSSSDFPPVGSYRIVYYDPENPQTAVLDCRDYAKNEIKNGTVFVAVAIILLIFLSRREGGIKEIKTVIFGS